MANLTTDGKLCIERELTVIDTKVEVADLNDQFDIEATCNWIKDNGYEKVCLQFPDDLLCVSAQISEEIKRRAEVDVYILGDTSYASCCVDSVAAMHVLSDALVHYGHSCFSKTDIPTFTVLPKEHLDIEETIKNLRIQFQNDSEKKLCLFYDAQFEHLKEKLSSLWFRAYPNSYIAFVEMKETPNKYLARSLKNASLAVVSFDITKDCACIYLGSRGQTAFNYTIAVEALEWHLLEPEHGTLEPMNESAWFKRRRFIVEKCKDANTVGILVCKISGEQTKDIIKRLKDLCKANGKKSYIVSVGKPNVAKLANFPEIDIYVLIACPENDLYSNRDFYQPIAYPFELEVALNTNRDPYSATHIIDFDELLPGRRFYCDIARVENNTDVSLITGKIRETRVDEHKSGGTELVAKEMWAVENIGSNLQERSWAGLEQKLGETGVKEAEKGRQGIPLQYSNEPE